jgi:hypothetical protein
MIDFGFSKAQLQYRAFHLHDRYQPQHHLNHLKIMQALE